jgi:outer membrane lipoprotein-sorting protein
MNHLRNKFLLSFILFLAGLNNSPAQDAAGILENMDKVLYAPKDKQAKVIMVLTDKAGNEKVREATLQQKGPDKRLYRYTKPESQAGIATLSLSDSVMWMYMPAFEKPKKISLLAKSQAFNGTDFSNEDMVTTPYSRRYTPSFQQTEEDAYVLKLVPKIKNSAYLYIIARVHKSDGYPLRMEYYNGQGKKFKEAVYRYEKVGKYWNAAEVVMTDLEKKHSTKIQLTEVKFDQGLSDDLFLVANLKPAGVKKEN